MQKAFEKITDLFSNIHRVVKADEDLEWNRAVYQCTEFVNKVAEEYKGVTTCYLQIPCEYQNEDIRLSEVEFADDDGWIPCEKLVPVETDEDLAGDYLDHIDELIEQGVFKAYLVTIEGAKMPTELYYVGSAGEVLWYDEITEEFYKVIAWQELPKVYQPKGE